MTIKTKHDLGDIVWYLERNKGIAKSGKVTEIWPGVVSTVVESRHARYSVDLFSGSGGMNEREQKALPESYLFKSKKALLASL